MAVGVREDVGMAAKHKGAGVLVTPHCALPPRDQGSAVRTPPSTMSPTALLPPGHATGKLFQGASCHIWPLFFVFERE